MTNKSGAALQEKKAVEAIQRRVVVVLSALGGVSPRGIILRRNCLLFNHISKVSELFDMGSATKRLEKQVDEANREIANLNERIGVLEQEMSAVKELMKEALVRMGNAIVSGLGAEQTASDCPRTHIQQRRLEMPAFFGEDPCGWVLKAEKYFMICGVEEGEKVAYATLCMEGKALNWLLLMEARNPIHGWEMLKNELSRRFGSKGNSAYEQLLSVRQLSTVARYREEFELLSAPLRDISDEKLLCAFINGLNDDVKAGVESIVPRDLAHVMSRAQEIEDKLKISERLEDVKLTRSFGNDSRPDEICDDVKTEKKEEQETVIRAGHKLSNSGLANSQQRQETERSNMELPRGSSMSKTVSKPKEMGGTDKEEGGFKRLTEAEFNHKMKMSLCVRCDKKYSKNHKCKNKHLRLLVVKDEDEICNQEETEKEKEQEIVTEGGYRFKFLGKIGSREVIVFFGTAATHNFISRELVTALQLPLERTRSFRVNSGFGPKAEGAEVCNRVVLKTHGIEMVVERFFPTDLGIADVVLGNEWLRSLGMATLQGNPMTLTFEWHGRTVTLQSDPSLTKGYGSGLMMLEWI